MVNKIKFFILCLLASSFLYADHPYRLAVTAIFQDEGPYLKEWIDYHLKQGVQKFYLYNNNSTDDYRKVLKPYLKAGIVDLIDWKTKNVKDEFYNFANITQPQVYTDAVNRARGQAKWLAIIDIDEFIVPVHSKNLVDILEAEFSDCAGIAINWQCYGTSNKYLRLSDSIIQNLTMKMRWDHSWNKFSKPIVQPDLTVKAINPHECSYIDGYYAVDTHKNKHSGMSTQEVFIDILRINHYWTRDVNYFLNKKVPRLKKWNNYLGDVFDHAAKMNKEFDPILVN